MKNKTYELLYDTQAQFNQAHGNSGNVTSVKPGVAYIVESESAKFNSKIVNLMVWYYIENISEPTKIYNNQTGITLGLKEIIIDKAHIPASAITNTYQFSEPGLHIIRYRYTSLGTIRNQMFQNCPTIVSVKVPSSVTTIDQYTFAGCSSLTSFTTNSTIYYRDGVFDNCRKLKDLTLNWTPNAYQTIRASGNPDDPGTLHIIGNYIRGNGQGGYGNTYYKTVIIEGDLTSHIGTYFNGVEVIKVTGNCSGGNSSIGLIADSYPKFIEILGNVSSTQKVFKNAGIVHFGYNEKVTAVPATINIGVVTTLYVGDGSSQTHDQAILDEYLADENWAPYASKLDLWYNYHGEYRQE